MTYSFFFDNGNVVSYTVCMTIHILTKAERAEQKSRTFLKVINSLPLETVLDWAYRSYYASQDGEPLSLRRYLEEIKDSSLATIRMSKIDNAAQSLSYEERQRREQILEDQKQPFPKN